MTIFLVTGFQYCDHISGNRFPGARGGSRIFERGVQIRSTSKKGGPDGGPILGPMLKSLHRGTKGGVLTPWTPPWSRHWEHCDHISGDRFPVL